MNRDEAFEALEYLRRVVKETRDDSALQNWGVIWMVHAFTNGAGFALTGWLLDHGRRTLSTTSGRGLRYNRKACPVL